MPWYGPRGNCGCCGDVIVPCECGSNPLINDGPCTPEDPGYFRNVAVEISELPIEIWRRTEAILDPCVNFPGQNGEEKVNFTEYKIVGMNQFNGTYPGTHYYYDAELDEYYEAEATNGCGFWGYTTTTKTLRLEITRNTEHEAGEIIDRQLYGEVEFDVTFDVIQGGIIPPTYPIPKPSSWDFRLHFGDLDQPLIPALTQSPLIPTNIDTWFAECRPLPPRSLAGTNDTNDPIAVVRGAAAINTHDLITGVVGGAGGAFPSANFPAGVQLLHGDVCALDRIETVYEYEPHTQTNIFNFGGCNPHTTTNITYSPWSIRRKLLYDGRPTIP